MQYVRGPFPSKFRIAVGSLMLAMGTALTAASAIAAPASSDPAIYKWVDERGVVNYGNAEVPKNLKVSVVDTSPQIAAQPDARAASDNAGRSSRTADSDMLREQLARSRDEIARLKQGSGNGRRNEGFAAWRLQCESERRVDCDEDSYAAETRLGPVVRQPVVAPVAQPKPSPTPKTAENRPKPSPASMQIAGTSKPSVKSTSGSTPSLQ